MIQAMLSGAIVRVEDLDEAISFYQAIPGARLTRSGPGAMVEIGNGRLELVSEPRGISLCIEASDLDAFRDKMAQNGCECTESNGGYSFADPAGNIFVVRQQAPREPGAEHGVPFNPEDREEDRGLG
jgi:catechol 2,3-dioxygenase-like lactoylglutathione lyase family enzyme